MLQKNTHTHAWKWKAHKRWWHLSDACVGIIFGFIKHEDDDDDDVDTSANTTYNNMGSPDGIHTACRVDIYSMCLYNTRDDASICVPARRINV